MPYNGSGSFSILNTFVPGTTILSSAMNANLTDIATGLSTAVLKNGTQALTANIPFGGFGITNLGSLGSAAAATVASASTANVLGAGSLFVNVTGTTTITSLGTGANQLKIIIFSDSLVLTNNPVSLILPGNANITTSSGDTMIIRSSSSSNVQVISYQRASGSPIIVPIPITGGGTGKTTGAFVKAVIQKFTGSGTYTPTTGMLYCKITCVGGGGGGGGVALSSNSGSGAGGGGGSTSIKYCTASDIGVSKAVTIGSAGTGGVAGTNNGSSGGDTSVGSLCIGKGGGGGGGSAANSSAGTPGVGGVAGTGDVTIVGQDGTATPSTAGAALSSRGFSGGSSTFGGGGRTNGANAGTDGNGFGSGGGGGGSISSSAAAAGGNGALGYVLIEEYCNQ